MNNLNTIGQYLSSLQQNLALLARGLADIKAEVEVLKQSNPLPDSTQAINTVQPSVNIDVSDMRREFEMFKMEVNKKLGKIDELDSSIESIFSSLQSSLPFPVADIPNTVQNIVPPTLQATSTVETNVDDSSLNCNIDDIEIIAKKSPAPKKKTTKKN